MSNLSRFNPFGEMSDPFSEGFFKGFALRPVQRLLEGEPQIRLDLTEDENNYFIKAELPGVHKEDIKVTVNGNLVLLRAEVKKEIEKKVGSKLIRSERYFGSIARSFSLDSSVDLTCALAQYENGILQLTLPKKASGESHQLKIS